REALREGPHYRKGEESPGSPSHGDCSTLGGCPLERRSCRAELPEGAWIRPEFRACDRRPLARTCSTRTMGRNAAAFRSADRTYGFTRGQSSASLHESGGP